MMTSAMSAKEKINHAHGRTTNDYTPTMPGGKEEMAAINARREMLNVLAMPRNPGKPERKNHLAKVVNGYNVLMKRWHAEQAEMKGQLA